MKVTVLKEIRLDNINRLDINLKTKIPRILEGIGLYATASIHKNFETEGRPQRWAPLAPPTVKQKQKKNLSPMILHASSDLALSIGSEVDSVQSAVLVGPMRPLVYARIHDKGGMAGRGKKVKIPQRRYLFLQDEDREYINNFIKEQMVS